VELCEKLQSLFRIRPNVELALLFGSQARGEAGSMSDVDIAVLFTARPSLLSLGGLIQEASELVKNRVDLVELDGLEADDPRLAYEIAAEAKVIFERSDGAFVDYKTRAFLAYFDAQPFLDSVASALSDRIESGSFGRPIHA